MNRKIYIVITVIAIILVCFFLGVIVVNQGINRGDMTSSTEIKEENNLKKEENIEEKKSENIVLNSKIGNEILDLIYIPNIYSDIFFREIEASGLNDRSKIIFTFAKIMNDDKFSSLRRQSQDYVGEYITKDDLQSIANKIFSNASNLKHQEVFLSNSYDKKNGNYIKIPTGFVEFSYIKDIPYKIEEVGDNLTVYTYRLYINCNTSDTLEENVNSTQTIFYNSEKTNKAVVINDENMDNENTQTDFLNTKISSGEISKDKLKQGVYKITRKGNSYFINDIK